MGNVQTYLAPIRRFRTDRRGTSVLEMTVLAPFLLLIALGVIEFGRALQHYHTINKSMRDAARFLARVPITCAAPPSTSCTIDDPNDLTRARNLALTGYPTGTQWLLNYWTDLTTVSVTITPFDNSGGTYRGQPNMPRIEVRAQVPFQDFGFLGFFGLDPITFDVRHTQLHIGE